MRPLLVPLLFLALFLPWSTRPACGSDVPVHGFRVVASWPHDASAFTQGLVMANGVLYESTGLYGRSTLRRVDLETGQVLQRRALPARLFGEGLTVWQGELVQLTWRAGRALRYDRQTFAPLGELAVPGEGWGLTQDGESWIVSDGSATLRFLEPGTGVERRRVLVQDDGRPVRLLNELEMVPVRAVGGPAASGAGAAATRHELWANIWHSDRLVRVDPGSGRALGYVDLAGLWPDQQRPEPEAVLNGIAYDARHGRLLVTGKLWPRIYWIAVPGLVPGPAGFR